MQSRQTCSRGGSTGDYGRGAGRGDFRGGRGRGGLRGHTHSNHKYTNEMNADDRSPLARNRNEPPPEDLECAPVWLQADQETRREAMQGLTSGDIHPVIGERPLQSNNAHIFCDQTVFDQLDSLKKRLEATPRSTLDADLRHRSNPHEPLLSNQIFRTRNAKTLATLDRAFDFALSKETPNRAVTKRPLCMRDYGQNVDRDEGVFYSAETCCKSPHAAQYILMRKAFYNARCFASQIQTKLYWLPWWMSLSYLDTPTLDPSSTYDSTTNHYLAKHSDAFIELVLKGTVGEGAHLYHGDCFTADTGAAGKMLHESAYRDTYMGQLFLAASTLREGGTAVIHLLDTFTNVSIAVIFLAHLVFDKVSLYKPNTSRPSNGEKYLVCLGLRIKESHVVAEYIRPLRDNLTTIEKESSSVVSLLPDSFIDSFTHFIQYAMEANTQLAQRQCRFIERYLRMIEDKNLIDSHQADCLRICVPYYLVPFEDKPKPIPRWRQNPTSLFESFLPKTAKSFDYSILSHPIPAATDDVVKRLKEGTDSLMVTITSTPSLDILVVAGRNAFIYGIEDGEWHKIGDQWFLPMNSVFLVENPRASDGIDVIRIIDVAVIDGDIVGRLPYKKRLAAASKCVRACTKFGVTSSIPLLFANTVNGQDIHKLLNSIKGEDDDSMTMEEGGYSLTVHSVRLFNSYTEKGDVSFWSAFLNHCFVYSMSIRSLQSLKPSYVP